MNKNFVIYDASGKIIRTGNIPEEDWDIQILAPGESIIEAEACCAGDTVCTINNCVLPGTAIIPVPEPVVPTTPAPLSTADQLDLLWQAMDAGTFPKAEPFYSAIKAQKETAQ